MKPASAEGARSEAQPSGEGSAGAEGARSEAQPRGEGSAGAEGARSEAQPRGVKLIVGLGNPGRRYAATRHNVGFRIVEALAARHRIAVNEERFAGRFGAGRVAGEEVALLEPQTYMNESGEAVAQALHGLGIDDPGRDLLVVYDDVDLPLGRLRLRAAGGDGGHQGMRDVIGRLGRQDFARLRFGIGRSGRGAGTTAHVLERFSADEEALLAERIPAAAAALEAILRDGVGAAMNRVNAVPPE
jgi:PTH1 family peptidyl-tRNA hydrolase